MTTTQNPTNTAADPEFDGPTGFDTYVPTDGEGERGSWSTRLVAAIEDTWSAIQDWHPDVPEVMITLGAGARRDGLVLGHFAALAWQSGDRQVSELFVGGEGLAAGATGLLVTLLHEAAHGIAHTRGVKDTSRQGRYHSDRYRVLAEEIGLTVTRHPQLGWSPSDLAPGTADRYTDQLAQLGAALVAHRRLFR